MLIADVEPIAITWPLQEGISGSADVSDGERLDLYLIRLTTDSGICGWGEARLAQESHFLPITEMLGDMVIGADPLNRGILWDRLRHMVDAEALARRPSQYRHDLHAVLSAVDMALWDLTGKKLGVSVARLLGGVRSSRLDTYVSGLCMRSGEDLPGQARSIVEQGFRAIKMRLSGEPGEDLRAVAAVRRALGNQVVLITDAGGAYEDFDIVRKLGLELAKHDIYWLEDPFAAGRWDEYHQLAAALEPPLAGGKTIYGITRLYEPIRRQALHVVMPDPCLCGGITAAWLVGTLGQLHGVRMSVHSGDSPLALMAAANLSAALPYAERLELTERQAALAQVMMCEPPEYAQGFLIFSDGPGPGLAICTDFLGAYARPVTEV